MTILQPPIVSVICYAYNHEKFIKETLDGFVMQKTNFSFEIIIHDDASTDLTTDIIREYEKNYPNIFKPIYQQVNQYSLEKGRVTKICYAAAKGNYIALCEGDDYWIDPYKLQKQVEFLEGNPDYGLVCTDFNILHQSTGKIEESLFKNQPTKFPIYKNFEDFLLAAGFMAPCTWVCRKELIPLHWNGLIDASFSWLLHVYANSKVHVLLDTTTVYRILEESASHSKSLEKTYTRALGLLHTQLDYVRKYNLSESFKLKVLQSYYKTLLPTLVALSKNDEIAKASFYLQKLERTCRINLLFFFAKIPFGSKLILLLYWLKNNVMTKL